MARLVTLGGEISPAAAAAGSPEYPGGFTGSVAQGLTNIRSGSGCILCTDNTGSQASFVTLIAGPAVGASTTLYVRFYVQFRAGDLPAPSAQIVALAGIISARATSGGKLQLWNESGTPAQIGSDSSATIVTNTYYRV